MVRRAYNAAHGGRCAAENGGREGQAVEFCGVDPEKMAKFLDNFYLNFLDICKKVWYNNRIK